MNGDSSELTKKELALQLGVSRASLYYQPTRPAKDEELRQRIEEEMALNPDAGSRPIASALRVNRKRVQRVMRKYGLKPALRAKAPVKLGDIGQPEMHYPCITRLWSPIRPNVLWVSDFTFIPFRGRFIYLATILDGFTGEVLAATVMTSHNTELILKTILAAVEREGQLPDWFHSDQGSEYTAENVSELLRRFDVQISMSPKASPWRNPMQESFYGRFKIALGNTDRFGELTELVEYIYQLIHRFNFHRIKNRLKMTPYQFRQAWEKQLLHTYPQNRTSYESPPGPPSRCSAPAPETTTNFLNN